LEISDGSFLCALAQRRRRRAPTIDAICWRIVGEGALRLQAAPLSMAPLDTRPGRAARPALNENVGRPIFTACRRSFTFTHLPFDRLWRHREKRWCRQKR
jgi:hypothetical protein